MMIDKFEEKISQITQDVNNWLKGVVVSLFYMLIVSIFVYVFYFLKSYLSFTTDFQFTFEYFFAAIIQSVGMLFNLLFAYVFFIRIAIKQRSLKTANKKMLIWIGVLFLNIVANAALMLLLYDYLDLNLILVNTITFAILFITNRIIKKNLLKKKQ